MRSLIEVKDDIDSKCKRSLLALVDNALLKSLLCLGEALFKRINKVVKLYKLQHSNFSFRTPFSTDKFAQSNGYFSRISFLKTKGIRWKFSRTKERNCRRLR